MIGFIVAMHKEASLFLERLDCFNKDIIAGKEVYTGKFMNKDFVLIISGIGKVNAALSAQIIIDKFVPNIIINFGVAGGKENSGLAAGDVVLLDKVCQKERKKSEILRKK